MKQFHFTKVPKSRYRHLENLFNWVQLAIPTLLKSDNIYYTIFLNISSMCSN